MYSVFRNLAIIILSAKFFGLVARKFKAPQVVGEIIAGLIIGPCLLNLVHISDTISIFAEIGVVLLMFSTGLGTNLKELIKAGPIATLIACVGVAVPLAGGTLLYSLFYGFSALGSQEFYRALFIGTIMTATSVSITVATLQELGHLKSFLGTTIVSAAVIDDVIGIVVLTCVLGASSGTGTGLGKVLMNTVLFFATAIGVGIIAHFAMKWLDKRNPHTQRITIVSMAFCFAMAYIAEAYFGIADITGAYILFGSRARGDYKRTSDIDIAVSGGDFAGFALDVEEETSTLLEFDIVNLDREMQDELRETIEREGKLLYEKV